MNYVTLLEKAAQYNVDPMVAAAIIQCESKGNPHAIHRNRNGTVDRGLGQINSVHAAEAARRGNDLMSVEGNLDYTLYLMGKNGFRDYQASERCWSRVIADLGSDTS